MRKLLVFFLIEALSFLGAYIFLDIHLYGPTTDAHEKVSLLTLSFCVSILVVIIRHFFLNFLEVSAVLHKSELKYRRIFESISDIYFEFEEDGTIVVVSPSIQATLGYRMEEVVGTRVDDYYTCPEQKNAIVAYLIENKELNHYEVLFNDKNGNAHRMWVHLKTIESAEEERRFVGTMRDMTKYIAIKEQQKETEEKYKTLFNKMLNGYVIMKPVYDEKATPVDFLVVDANPALLEQISYVKRSDVVGRCWLKDFGFNEQTFEKHLQVLITGNPIQYEGRSMYVSDYFLLKAFKIDDERVGVVFDNISSYKQAIFEVNRVNENLERLVEERTTELKAMVEEIEVFSNTVSHDLKSPLRAIDGYMALMEAYLPLLPLEGQHNIQQVHQICTETIEMINKLLEYSATTKSNVVRENTDIEAIFVDVFKNLKMFYPNREIQLRICNPLPHVLADRVLIRQVIYNGLSNAIKFTRDKEYGVIEVGYQEMDHAYQFYIKDNGVGFDMAYSKKLFGIFQRLHTQKDFEGSGIGLATLQKIIQKHGGEVKIEGAQGEGATLYFTLPILAIMEEH